MGRYLVCPLGIEGLDLVGDDLVELLLHVAARLGPVGVHLGVDAVHLLDGLVVPFRPVARRLPAAGPTGDRGGKSGCTVP